MVHHPWHHTTVSAFTPSQTQLSATGKPQSSHFSCQSELLLFTVQDACPGSHNDLGYTNDMLATILTQYVEVRQSLVQTRTSSMVPTSNRDQPCRNRPWRGVQGRISERQMNAIDAKWNALYKREIL